MKPRIIVRNREKTPLLESQVLKELHKLDKFIDQNDPLVEIDFVIVAEGPTHTLYNVELRVFQPHADSIVRVEGYELDFIIPQVIHKMEKELRAVKERRKDKKEKPRDNNDAVREDKDRQE